MIGRSTGAHPPACDPDRVHDTIPVPVSDPGSRPREENPPPFAAMRQWLAEPEDCERRLAEGSVPYDVRSIEDETIRVVASARAMRAVQSRAWDEACAPLERNPSRHGGAPGRAPPLSCVRGATASSKPSPTSNRSPPSTRGPASGAGAVPRDRGRRSIDARIRRATGPDRGFDTVPAGPSSGRAALPPSLYSARACGDSCGRTSPPPWWSANRLGASHCTSSWPME